MSDEPTRDLDTRTPTVEEAALYWQWGGHMWQAPERFDRMIAKIKADALREAADKVEEPLKDEEKDGDTNPYYHGARYGVRRVADWMRVRADRIEEEP